MEFVLHGYSYKRLASIESGMRMVGGATVASRNVAVGAMIALDSFKGRW